MRIDVLHGRRVVCEHTIKLPMSARRAWGQLRDFHRYAAHDHFHAGFLIEGRTPRAGARLVIKHRYGPIRVWRIGRILRWREGSGFAFSDLSRAGPARGFPHVMQMSLSGLEGEACALRIRVTGRWTAPTPRWVARVWLWWVFGSIVARVQADMMTFHAATRHFAVSPDRVVGNVESPAPLTGIAAAADNLTIAK